MIHFKKRKIKSLLMKGGFGLEKEALRILEDGTFSHSPHPFPGHPKMVRDFCENQLEINTGVSDTPEEAVEELEAFERLAREKLLTLETAERLWPFSNPPYIRNEEDIPVARFEGAFCEKTRYRNYLARNYGRTKMTFCGIHVNFSLSEDLLREDFAFSGEKDYESYRNGIYLGMARNLMENGWIANVLLSASPLLDRSFLTKGLRGGADFLGMASIRCSELGYWNHFVPTFDFASLQGYAESIRSYIREGLLTSHTELYYPIRIKSRGENSLDELVRTGVDHLELRCVDLNPFAFGGLDIRDLKFLHLLFVYDACLEPVPASREWQIKTVMNFKNAARYDIDGTFLMRRDREVVSVREASLGLLRDMQIFFDGLGIDTEKIMDYQLSKLLVPGNRYAERVRAMFSDDFVEKGLKWMKEKEGGSLKEGAGDAC